MMSRAFFVQGAWPGRARVLAASARAGAGGRRERERERESAGAVARRRTARAANCFASSTTAFVSCLACAARRGGLSRAGPRRGARRARRLTGRRGRRDGVARGVGGRRRATSAVLAPSLACEMKEQKQSQSKHEVSALPFPPFLPAMGPRGCSLNSSDNHDRATSRDTTTHTRRLFYG